jgi:hypothetical protein
MDYIRSVQRYEDETRGWEGRLMFGLKASLNNWSGATPQESSTCPSTRKQRLLKKKKNSDRVSSSS